MIQIHTFPRLLDCLPLRMRKQAILDTTQAWIDEAKTWNVPHANHLIQLREQFSALLNKL
jgi:hypothetical protein